MKTTLKLEQVEKSYNGQKVIKKFSLILEAPGIYCLTAPSGAGKTTLFRLILGLEQPDSGSITTTPERMDFSAIFQEDRLIEHLNPVENIALVLENPNKSFLVGELSHLLPKDSLYRPVSTLSGGMKRRCAFMRAMMASSQIVIMDEPFTGLDEATKNIVIHYLKEHQKGRLFLIATHDKEDIKKLEATEIFFGNPQ